MIIYATKQTFERYKLKDPTKLISPSENIIQTVLDKDCGDRLFEWGAKLFYFNRKKCIQVVNFASKFTLFLFDIKMSDLKYINELIAHYLFELYKNDREMTNALHKMFKDNFETCFAKLTDKSAISTLNTTQRDFAGDGYRFYEYIQDEVLKTMVINHDVNFEWLFTMKINGKTEYFCAGEKFKEIVLERYGTC